MWETNPVPILLLWHYIERHLIHAQSSEKVTSVLFSHFPTHPTWLWWIGQVLRRITFRGARWRSRLCHQEPLLHRATSSPSRKWSLGWTPWVTRHRPSSIGSKEPRLHRRQVHYTNGRTSQHDRVVIRLQRIYNFWLLHAILYSVLDIIELYYTLLYYFWD